MARRALRVTGRSRALSSAVAAARAAKRRRRAPSRAQARPRQRPCPVPRRAGAPSGSGASLERVRAGSAGAELSERSDDRPERGGCDRDARRRPCAPSPEAPTVAACGTPCGPARLHRSGALWPSGGDIKVVFDEAGVPRVATPAPAPTKGDKLALAETPKKWTSPVVRPGRRQILRVAADTSAARSASERRGRARHGGHRPGPGRARRSRPRSSAPRTSSSASSPTARRPRAPSRLAFVALDDQAPMLLSEEGSGGDVRRPHAARATALSPPTSTRAGR